MNPSTKLFCYTLILFLIAPLHAGNYYVLCEGNFGQANASLWSIDESMENVNGPLIWDIGTDPLGDVGQSLTLFDDQLFAVMNGSHEIRVLDLVPEMVQSSDIELPGSSPRYMAVDANSRLGFVSSWTVGGLIVLNMDTHSPIDTIYTDGLPEQLLLSEDDLFVTLPLQGDWSTNNKVAQFNLSQGSPELVRTYEVISGPEAMLVSDGFLYVTSVYYNDAWESFSGTSRINLTDQTVVTVFHGAYTNYTADLEIIQGIVHRTFGTSLVPLNADLTLNEESSIGNIAGIYTHKVLNDHILVGSSDFVAPDHLLVLALSGEELSSFNVGALPSDIIYHQTGTSDLDQAMVQPNQFTLGNNYPNPFNPLTTIPYTINRSENLTLKIYDIQGRQVVELFDGFLPQGNYMSTWDGRGTNGAILSSGIYHAVLSSPTQQAIIKLNFLK